MAGRSIVVEILGDARGLERAFTDADESARKLAGGFDRVDAAASKLDAVGTRARVLDDNLSRVGTSGDRSRGVLANMVGNSAQDIGVLAGVSGSAGVALGQMAEYASEGSISLKGFAATVGPMAGVAAIVQVISTRLQAAAKADAWNTKRVEAYEDALWKGATALEAFEKTARETREILVQFPSSVFGDGLVDITPAMARLNVNLDTFKDLVGGSYEEVVTWKEGMLAAGADADDLRLILMAVAQEQGRLTTATNGDAIAREVFRKTTLGLLDTEEAHERQLKSLNEKYDDLGRSTGAQTTATDNHYAALGRLNSQYDQVTPRVQTAKTNIDFFSLAADAAARKIDLVAEAYARMAGQVSQETAWLNLKGQFDSVIQSVFATQVAINEQTISATEGAERQRLAILGAKDEVIRYAEQVGLVPNEVQTVLNLMDNGQLDAALMKLAALEKQRNVLIWYKLLPDPKTGNAAVTLGLNVGAEGGIVNRPTFALIGEAGPEAVVPLHRTPGNAPLPAGPLFSSTGEFHFHVHGDVYGVENLRHTIRQALTDWSSDTAMRLSAGRRG